MLGTWKLNNGYCYPCRMLHEERGDLPSCDQADKTFNSRSEALKLKSTHPTVSVTKSYCEVIQDVPFTLLSENKLAFQSIGLIYRLSDQQEMQFMRNKKQYQTYVPTLSALVTAFEILDLDLSYDDTMLLIDKITLIHRHNLTQALS